MKNLSLIASALAMLGLTACEKGLVDGVADIRPLKNYLRILGFRLSKT